MNKVILIDLDGQDHPFRIHEDAYDALSAYLDRARAGLTHDPDRAEVVGDLERSIGAKLTDRLGASDRIVTGADIEAVLADVGPVGAGDERPAQAASERPRGRRRLARIREGQDIAGVCTGLSAYSEIDLGWVRTIFFFAILLTGGLFLVVYVVMAFVLPVVPTREAWIAEQDGRARS